MRSFWLAGVAAAVLGLASQASAATVVINSSHTIGGFTTHIAGGAPYPDVLEGPEAMNITVGNGPSQDIIAFCVDLFHLWTGAPQTYQTGDVATDSSGTQSGTGNPLSDLISGEIGFLAGLGQFVPVNTADGQDRLAGIQGAIWQIEYPAFTVGTPPGSANASTYLNHYVTLANAWGATHPNFQGHATGIYSVGSNGQGFGTSQGFATGGVPEPATWALMIGGFGLAGATLRRRRAATLA
jgi:hypothetical protein